MVDSPSPQNPAGQSDWARAMANNFLGSQSCGSQSPAAKGSPTPTGSPQGQHLPWNHWQYEQGSDDEVPTAAAEQQPSKSPNQEEAVKPRKKKKETAAVAQKKDAKPPKKAKTKEGSKEVSKEGQEANVDCEEEPPKKKRRSSRRQPTMIRMVVVMITAKKLKTLRIAGARRKSLPRNWALGQNTSTITCLQSRPNSQVRSHKSSWNLWQSNSRVAPKNERVLSSGLQLCGASLKQIMERWQCHSQIIVVIVCIFLLFSDDDAFGLRRRLHFFW